MSCYVPWNAVEIYWKLAGFVDTLQGQESRCGLNSFHCLWILFWVFVLLCVVRRAAGIEASERSAPWRHGERLSGNTKHLVTVRSANISLYTVSHKKTRHFYFCDNSGKYWPILIILSLSHSQMNCRKRLNKICHLTSNLLPHYHAKVECSTQLLYSMLFQFNCMLNHLFTVSVYQRC